MRLYTVTILFLKEHKLSDKANNIVQFELFI